MQYTSSYLSPLGKITLASDGEALTGLWLEGQSSGIGAENEESELSVFVEAKRWLGIYFTGKEPSFSVPVRFSGTEFQIRVWELLCTIPYGMTTTYGALAKIIAEERGIKKMSAQAVGGAVGANKISIIVPCHRVIGSDGSLTGYAGGTDKKLALLAMEGIVVG